MDKWRTTVIIVLVMLGSLRADDLLVKTHYGPIRGTTTQSYTGKDVAVFYGIPYAQPPTGKSRFAAPIELRAWPDELNATVPSQACYQKIEEDTEEITIIGDLLKVKKPWSEDCLKLHIWVPIPRRTKSTVMVYIHGGGFTEGHPLLAPASGATLAAEENVIVISMNYRLNVQGFLYLGIPEAPGNMGLMDQQMALKWIQRNIGTFGGNSNDVTIFGMSAGGASVGFQLLSPGSRNLFKRAILMSGTPNGVWAIRTKEDALSDSLKLAKFLGCGSDNRTKVFECLQSVEPNRFSDWGDIILSLGDLQFVPTVDGKFISDYPMNLLRQKEVKHTDIIIGGTSDEGSLFLAKLVPGILGSPDMGITQEQFQAFTKIRNKYNNLTTDVISTLYTDWTRPGNHQMFRDAFKNLFSDYYLDCAAEDFADVFSAMGNTIYRYVVDHRFTKLPLPKWVGTPHGLDGALHLGAATEKGSLLFNAADSTLSRRVMRWFANFARTGIPTGPGQSGPTWLPYTVKDKQFLRINSNSEMEKHFRTQRCTMLKKIILIAENRQECHQ